MNNVVLQSEEILLRRFSMEDVDDYYQVAHDPLVKQFVQYAHVETKGEAIELLSNYKTYDFVNDFYFAICDAKSGKIIGALLAFRTFSRILEVCYFIGSQYRGNGFCLKALQLFIDYLESNTPYSILFFNVRSDNIPSRNIMRKLGISIESDKQEYFRYFLNKRC